MPDIDINLEVLSQQDVDINAQALYGPKGDKGDKGDKGEQGIQGIQGPQGNDGYSPVANVTKSGNTTTVTITDANGTTTAEILDGTDGQDGADGADGYSPTATVTKSGSVATITITDKNGTTTAQVSDGVGSITDVQQNGVSVVSSGIANVIVPDAQIQADWSQSDNTKKDYIKNKPTKLSDFTDDLGTSPTHTHSQYLTSHQDISGKEDTSNKGVANGYAGLDSTGKVPTSQLPELGSTVEITYADSTTADLEKVKYQTESAFASRTTFPKDQIEVVEYNGETPLYFANVQSISVNTNYTFDNNGTFCTNSSSVAKVEITDSNSNSITVYDNTVRIPANCTFTSNQAGNLFFDNTYNGYLAGAVNNA